MRCVGNMLNETDTINNTPIWSLMGKI